MYGQDAVLDYDLSGLGKITGIKFFKPEYDDPKYFESFRGQVAFYCWSSGEYETISKWGKKCLTGRNWKNSVGRWDVAGSLSGGGRHGCDG